MIPHQVVPGAGSFDYSSPGGIWNLMVFGSETGCIIAIHIHHHILQLQHTFTDNTPMVTFCLIQIESARPPRRSIWRRSILRVPASCLVNLHNSAHTNSPTFIDALRGSSKKLQMAEACYHNHSQLDFQLISSHIWSSRHHELPVL